MGFSTSVIGKLETCRTRPSKQHAEKLDQVLRTPGTFVRLREAFFATSAIPDWFREWPDIEADAVTLRWFEPLIVPGLLQTQAYARALPRTRPDSTDEEIEAMVAARMDRRRSRRGRSRRRCGSSWTAERDRADRAGVGRRV